MPTSITSTAEIPTARCVELASVFQDPLLEESLPASAPGAVRRRQMGLMMAAQTACRACPLIVDCLYRAVVEYDVAGYVAGTTPSQRAQIRHRLDITVEPENFDTLAGVTGRHHQVNHSEVVRLRNANPDESLEMLAQRLGCSLSTVKRHCAASVASPRQRRSPQRVQLSTRSSPLRLLWLAPHQHPEALKRPNPELRGRPVSDRSARVPFSSGQFCAATPRMGRSPRSA
jgi:Transcription factor WhiB